MSPTSSSTVVADPAIRERLREARRRGLDVLPEPEAKAILALAGIAVPRSTVAPVPAEAATLAARLTGPLAVKVVAPGLLHKSDVGGVELGVRHDDVASACARIASRVRQGAPGAEVTGFLVEEMAPVTVEAVASVTRDARLGQIMMVGLGGLLVEVLRDVAFRLVPVDAVDVGEMLDELRGRALLGGLRGNAPVDRAALVATLLALGDLAARLEDEIDEIEINPLALSSRGVAALDALIRLRASESAADRTTANRLPPPADPRPRHPA